MISSPSRIGLIRRTQSTDVEFASTNDHISDQGSSGSNLLTASNRLDSIFRSRPKVGMNPIGTRKIHPATSNHGKNIPATNEFPAIRPSLSCPAAVFESPLKNLLPSYRENELEVSAIQFDEESLSIHEDDDPTLQLIDINESTSNNDNGNNQNEPVVESFPRNLNNAFLLANSPSMITIENISVPILTLPSYTLAPSLVCSLSPGLVSRISFYSIIRDINAEASTCHITDPHNGGNGVREVIAEDGRIHVHPTNECQSVLFGNATLSPNSLIDEEYFLLSAIASRTKEEVDSNQGVLLPSFAEAMGEIVSNENSSSVAGTSRTQLWKPGRSWWEAKSGKNPWVEPVVHNNRWRYLWPLIHYHKFIAKCIKKLKRNGVDVKSSSSTVSIFLRQEVCHVSDHLAFMSKYDSEEWTNALRTFNGWADHDAATHETVRSLVLAQRMLVDGGSGSEVNSSLLQSQLDETVLKAMEAVKEEAAKAAASENYDYGKGHCGGSASQQAVMSGRNEEDCASQASFFNANNQSSIHRSWSGSAGPNSATKSRKSRGYEAGSWREDYPPSYQNPGIYGPQYDHPPHPPHYSHPYGPTIDPQYYHHYEQYPHPPHPQMRYHHGGDMPYHDSQYHSHPPYGYNTYYDGSFHDGMMVDNSMHSDSYLHPQSAMATPNHYHHEPQYPMSPFHHDYWGHLNISQLPGLAPSPSMSMHTPSKPPRGNPNRSFRKRQLGVKNPSSIDGKAKGLIIFPKQASSPASKFLMSPQDKSNPYYTARNFQSSSLNQSTQEESFVLPTIEDFAHGSPMKSHGHPVELGMSQAPPNYYAESRNDKVEVQSSD